ncbi:X-ray repair cross-complementing protein 5-like [Mustelus asterias]
MYGSQPHPVLASLWLINFLQAKGINRFKIEKRLPAARACSLPVSRGVGAAAAQAQCHSLWGQWVVAPIETNGITSNVRDPVAQWVGVPASDPEAPGSSPTPGLDVQGRLNLKLGEGVELSVGVYNLMRSARKPSAARLYRESNEPVKTKTRWFNGETGSLLLPSDTKKAQVYGQRQIVLEKEETEELKRFDGPGLVLIGFKPLSLLKKHHHIRSPQFIYPDETLITGSTTSFSALLTKCLEKDVYAVCRYTPRRNTPPRFVALVPQEEALDDQKVQTIPPGFHLIYLPYADDVRKIGFTEKRVASEDQIKKMKSVVQKLRFKYRPESFENPVIQRHFRNLEALALDLKEPEEVEDLTLPKNDVMDRRIGQLAEEFLELVYPPGYNPGAKSQQKRKLSDAAGGAEKKPNVEVSLGKEEVRQYLRSGTLGKLTVPVLKEVCKQYGLRGSKKQELIDAITGHFAEN